MLADRHVQCCGLTTSPIGPEMLGVRRRQIVRQGRAASEMLPAETI